MTQEAQSKNVRPRRAWWQWVLGLGLLGVAAAMAGLRYLGTGRLVQPREVQVAAEMRFSDVVPARPGELAGCNLLIVTFDTTRADRLGCYGNPSIQTHALNRLASEGVIFSQVMAPSPTTLPSHSSLMTGLYPYHHEARANGLYRLDTRFVTLAEVLSDQGYVTGATVSASVLDSQFGIGQGFRDYDDETDSAESDDELSDVHVAERSGDKTVARAEAWVRQHAADKFFLWVHFFDPHSPYEAPEPYHKKFNPYDAEIAFTDAQLARLMQVVDELDLTNKTLVVVAGDHGEGLGQHGEGTHSCLVYQSTMHVPLIMRCGTRLGGGVHISRLVSLVDIMPTALAMLGIAPPDGLDGQDLTLPQSGPRVVLFETFQGLADHGWAALLGVRQESMKYIYGPRAELYDLAVDPFETSDLSAAQPQLAAELKQRLRQSFGEDLESAASAAPTHQLDPQQLAKLQSLGYLGGTGDEATAPADRPHPLDMMPLLRRVQSAKDLEKTKGLDKSIKELEKIARDHPELYDVHLSLGSAYFQQNELERAEEELVKCMEIRPNAAEPVLKLVEMLIRQRRIDEAIALCRETLERDPTNYHLLRRFGIMLTKRGEYGEAIELMIAALKIWPGDDVLPDRIADSALILSRSDDVIATFQELLASNPNIPMVRNALSRLLISQERYAEALSVLREGVELAPDRPDLINNLAFALATVPDESLRRPVEAVVMMEQLCFKTDYKDPRYLHTLSAVYGAQGRLDDAIAFAEKARSIASASDKPEYSQLVQPIGVSLESYKRAKKQAIGAALTEKPPAPMDGEQQPSPDEEPSAVPQAAGEGAEEPTTVSDGDSADGRPRRKSDPLCRTDALWVSALFC